VTDVVLRATAFLFDSDGVLVDSDRSVEQAWTQWASRYDLPGDEVLRMVHGRPAAQTVRALLPEPLQDEAVRLINRLELDTAASVSALPGAVACVSGLPTHEWAVVTSGTRSLAAARLRAAGIPSPAVLITADDVRRGKPAPDPYLAAAAALHQEPEACLVFEDAEPGVAAARAAGVKHVVGVGRETDHLPVDAFVPDLRSAAIASGTVTLSRTGP
jgi:mannitol-1-/sugar-/sorbitol-6-phosphatase